MRAPSHLIILGLLSLIAALGTQGCATQSGTSGMEARVPDEERIVDPGIRDLTPNDFATPASRTSPMMRAELTARNATGAAQSSILDVLFDFDRATLRSDALPVLEANAQRLKDEGAKRILLEGRGDEIGTAAYNLVLGERRAKSVEGYLHQLGLQVELRTASYGKDRPLCFDHSQACWQKNRSVHFVVKE
ncbi:MAG: OmpA family protein [Nitrospira sp.]|jgi:peptidoglycan-associated lipoprotein|nr:OmpA family protein [Nitrospira sp.]